jgi:DNA-binding transcriptional regulator YiaG
MMPNPSSIAKYIRDLRYRLEMTQEQFATVIGVTKSSVQRWERGECTPSPVIHKIIESLNANRLADTLH